VPGAREKRGIWGHWARTLATDGVEPSAGKKRKNLATGCCLKFPRVGRARCWWGLRGGHLNTDLRKKQQKQGETN